MRPAIASFEYSPRELTTTERIQVKVRAYSIDGIAVYPYTGESYTGEETENLPLSGGQAQTEPVDAVYAKLGNEAYSPLTYDSQEDAYIGEVPISLSLIKQAYTQSAYYTLPCTIKAVSGTAEVTQQYEIKLILNLDFIYDRTAQDVERVMYLNRVVLAGTATEEERALWMTDLKGALNRSDIERNLINAFVIAGMTRTPITVNEAPTLPQESFYSAFQANIEALRQSGYIISTTPETPSNPLNSWQKWNAIERILHDVYDGISKLNNSFTYAGDGLYAGGDIAIL